MKVLIVANGDAPRPESLIAFCRAADLIIAADGGVRHLTAINELPDIHIGDQDSVSQEDKEKMAVAEKPVLAFSPKKDETDLELCLGHALDHSPSQIIITGGYGGRLDQALGVISLLFDPRLAGIDARIDDGITAVARINGKRSVNGEPGDLFSLIPWGQDATDITTSGLEYPLFHETLAAHRTRGVSNVFSAGQATITFSHGKLLCIHIRQKAIGR